MNQTAGISRTLRWIAGTISNRKKIAKTYHKYQILYTEEEKWFANCSIALISPYLWDPVTYQIQIFQSAYSLGPWVCPSQWSGVSDCGPEAIYQTTANTTTTTDAIGILSTFPLQQPNTSWAMSSKIFNKKNGKIRNFCQTWPFYVG